jgi:hypothetical protein
MLQALSQDFPPDRVGQCNVGADVEAEPSVGPLRARRAARIDDVELGAVTYPPQDVVKEDRVRLARIRSPEQN